jgi:hypothetical protein
MSPQIYTVFSETTQMHSENKVLLRSQDILGACIDFLYLAQTVADMGCRSRLGTLIHATRGMPLNPTIHSSSLNVC